MSQKMGKKRPETKLLSRIRFLILDVDGVMTDGTIIYSSTGEELKAFNAKDGAGLKYWARAGHRAGIITGRSSPTVMRRAGELSIDLVEMNAKTKLPAYERMLSQAGVLPEEVAMIGDDLADYPLIVRSGLGVAVADAVEEVKDVADLVTDKAGGRGAVREAIDFILKGQGRWEAILKRYLAAEPE